MEQCLVQTHALRLRALIRVIYKKTCLYITTFLSTERLSVVERRVSDFDYSALCQRTKFLCFRLEERQKWRRFYCLFSPLNVKVPWQ